MKISLHPGSIYALGVAFSLILLSYGYLHHWSPKIAEGDARKENAKLLDAEAKKLSQAYKKIEAANTLVRERESAWRGIVATKTPPVDVSRGGINLNVNAFQLAVDTRRFRNNVQRAVNKQVVSGGVRVLSLAPVPSIGVNDPANGILAAYYNYPAIAFPVVIYDLGQIEVEGTYSQILANVRSWSRMPRYLAVADGLALSGTAPRLRGTYNLSIVGYIRTNGIFPPVPEGAAGGGAQGGAMGGPPSGPGGPGGSFRGGPPPGSPGMGGPGAGR